ncbi:MAG: hypoxanthine-guanine phosphoribosyltransferase [Proteobacteria bacterium]|nr:hypoxanthine-guanine phosphoribosyltransferase [Pseudomonadota bacterium]
MQQRKAGPADGIDGLPERADLLFDAHAVAGAIDRLAVQISVSLAERNPILMCVLHGGLPFTGELMKRLHFPLELGFLQVSRYADATVGGQLHWLAEPSVNVAGRTVLIVDDVLDEGKTLNAIHQRLLDLGAEDVLSAVLVDKKVPGRDTVADFTGLNCPDRYLFGCGMDYQGYWRNLPSIYAMSDR